MPQLFALTSPLITTSSGAKMGKTAAGAVWLDPDLVSPYEYWQYWRNTEDGDVGALPQAVHGAAASGDRAARRAERPGAQRGEEGAGDRGNRHGARPRGRRAGGRDGAAHVRGRRARRNAADGRDPARRARSAALGVLNAFAGSRPRGAPTARRAAGSRAAASRSTTSPSPTRRWCSRARDLTPEGVIKLSLGRKRHVLLKPI